MNTKRLEDTLLYIVQTPVALLVAITFSTYLRLPGRVRKAWDGFWSGGSERKKIKRKPIVVIIGLIFLVSFFYYVNSVTTPPRSYAWDLDFEEAEYDEVFKMYVREESREFKGEYLLRIWVEAPENTTVQVHLLQGFDRPYRSGGLRTREVESQFGIRATWTFRNNKVYWSGGSQPRGSEVNTEWDLYNPYRFRACSESRDAVVHIRIEFQRTDPNYPWGSTR